MLALGQHPGSKKKNSLFLKIFIDFISIIYPYFYVFFTIFVGDWKIFVHILLAICYLIFFSILLLVKTNKFKEYKGVRDRN